MKMDDPVPLPRCFGEGENDLLHPGGMLCGPPCLAPAPHLISTSLAGFFSFHPHGSPPSLVPAPHHLSRRWEVDVVLVLGGN